MSDNGKRNDGEPSPDPSPQAHEVSDQPRRSAEDTDAQSVAASDDPFWMGTETEATRPADLRPGKKRTWRTPVTILAILLGLIAAFVGGTMIYVRVMVDKVPRIDIMPSAATASTTARPLPKVQDGLPPMATVVMGTDSRNIRNDPGRSDSLMIAYMPGNREHVYLVSLPRDLWVKIEGHGYAKINAAYAYGGAPKTIETVQNLLGIQAQHAAVVNFETFTTLTDVLDGVLVDNPRAFTSDGHFFPQGPVTLKGPAALAFVRERYSLPNGDLDRAANQRLVVKAIVSKALSKGVLTNPAMLNELLVKTKDFVALDSGFTNDEIFKMSSSMRIKSGSDVRSFQLPIGGFGRSNDGQSIDVIDPQALEALKQAMVNDKMDEYWQQHSKDPMVTNNPGPIYNN